MYERRAKKIKHEKCMYEERINNKKGGAQHTDAL